MTVRDRTSFLARVSLPLINSYTAKIQWLQNVFVYCQNKIFTRCILKFIFHLLQNNSEILMGNKLVNPSISALFSVFYFSPEFLLLPSWEQWLNPLFHCSAENLIWITPSDHRIFVASAAECLPLAKPLVCWRLLSSLLLWHSTCSPSSYFS